MLSFSIILLFFIGNVYAEEENITNLNETNKVNTSNVELVNGTYYYLPNNKSSTIVIKTSDKLHDDRPLISMYAKPSCGCRYTYKCWYNYTFVDYCPHCHHYKCLLKNPKGVYEREYTCGACGADYCAVCGKEKYSWSHYYLTRI